MIKLKPYWWHFALTISLLFSFCNRPIEFEQSGFLYTSPEETVANLTQAYKEKNLEGYSSSFTDDSQFYQESEYLWGKAQEEKIHRKMFAAVKTIELKMTEAWNEEATETTRRTVYNYQLKVELLSEQILQGEGQVSLDFVKNENGYWQINSFRELDTGLRKLGQPVSSTVTNNDSVDYFPLRVGNRWTYENQLYPKMPDVQTTVTDSLIIRGQLYYKVQDAFFSTSLLRVDSLQNLKMLMTEDSSEVTLFKFQAAVGDTWSYSYPNFGGRIVVELISRQDSLEVPAGTFKDVLEFQTTVDFLLVSLDEFAANVGRIRQRGENQEVVLKSAEVNGRKYPVIVSVETHYFNWTKIKLKVQLTNSQIF